MRVSRGLLALLLCLLAGALLTPPGQAQTLELRELALPAADIGPDWLLREQVSDDVEGIRMLYSDYRAVPAGGVLIGVGIAPNEAAAQEWLQPRAPREAGAMGRGWYWWYYPVGEAYAWAEPPSPPPGVGDGPTVNLLKGMMMAGVSWEGLAYRVGPVVVEMVPHWRPDPAWSGGPGESPTSTRTLGAETAEDPIEQWRREAAWKQDWLGHVAALQEARLRLALAGRPLPLPAAPGCATDQPLALDGRFMALVGRLGDRVGQPLECTRREPGTLDPRQRTTGGELRWSTAEDVPAFTDGTTTWLLGPDGLVERLRAGPLYPWEVTPAAPRRLADQWRPVWAPVGHRLATGGSDGTVTVWDFDTGVQTALETDPWWGLDSLAWSPDDTRLLGIVSEIPVHSVPEPLYLDWPRRGWADERPHEIYVGPLIFHPGKRAPYSAPISFRSGMRLRGSSSVRCRTRPPRCRGTRRCCLRRFGVLPAPSSLSGGRRGRGETRPVGRRAPP